MPTKQNVRVGGYAVAIHGFIKVPSNDIKAQIDRMKAVDDAITANDASKLVSMMEIDEDGISQKFVNRMKPKGAEPATQGQLLDKPTGQADQPTGQAQATAEAAEDPRPKSLRK